MDTVVYDRIEDVLGRIESLYGRVEDTYLVAKDILLGTQISDWIADLKASGTASATYSDATRMNALIANEDAAKNQEVNQLLFDYAYSNNKIGVFLESCVGDTSSVSFSGLTTFSSLINNAATAQELFANKTISEFIVNNSSALSSLYSSYTSIKDYQSLSGFASAIASKTSEHRLTAYSSYGGSLSPLSDSVYFTTIKLSNGAGSNLRVTITHPDDTTTVREIEKSASQIKTYTFNMFAKNVTAEKVDSQYSYPTSTMKIYKI